MKREICASATVLLLSLCLLPSAVVQAGQQERQRTKSSNGVSPGQESLLESVLRPVSNDAFRESDVSIAAKGVLSNYSAYQDGDYFYIEIPEVYDPHLQMSKPGGGFEDVRVQKREGQIVLAFLLSEGKTARVTQRGDKLQIVFLAEGQSGVGVVRGRNEARSATMTGIDEKQGEKTATNGNWEMKTTTAETLTKFLSPIAAEKREPASLLLPVSNASLSPGSAIGPRPPSELDLSVPESPAFTVLGLTPQTVVRPASPRALATALLNGVDREGNFQTGVAIDTAPYMLFFGEELSLRDYRDSYMTQVLARTQVSFATTKGASEDDKSARLALGFHVTPWDRGDPRKDELLTECFRNSLSLDLPGTPEQQQQVLKERWRTCQEEAHKRNWNRSSWVVGAAPSWLAPTGNLKGTSWNGGGVWTSFAYGFEEVPVLKDMSQLILHARYRSDEQVLDPKAKGKFFTQDSLLFGLRLRVGVPNFIGNLEGVYIHNNPHGRSSDDFYRISLGAERKLTNDLWLSLTVGGEGGRHSGKNQAFALATFKYALSRELR